MKSNTVVPRVKAEATQSFESGKLAFKKGQVVTLVVARHTIWVFDPKSTEEDRKHGIGLLYTYWVQHGTSLEKLRANKEISFSRFSLLD